MRSAFDSLGIVSRRVLAISVAIPTLCFIVSLAWGVDGGVISAGGATFVLLFLTLRQFQLARVHPLQTFMLGVAFGSIFSLFGECVNLYWLAVSGHMVFPNLFHFSMLGWALILPLVLAMTPSRREMGRRDPITSIEGIMVGAVLCLTIWQILGIVVPNNTANMTTAILVVNILVRCVVLSFTIIVSIRDHTESRWMSSASMAGIQICDFILVLNAFFGHAYPPYMAILICLFWAIFTESLTLPNNYSEFTNIEERARVELRQSFLAASLFYSAVLAALGLSIYRYFAGYRVTDFLVFSLLVIVSAAALIRETIRSRENRHLTTALVKSASTDVLTGLGNRRELSAFLDRLTRPDQANSFDLLMFDLDGFKEVNSRFGHSRGDELLVAAARAISTTARRRDALCVRLGGDEFCVVLASGTIDAMQFGHEIIDDLTAAISSIDGAMQVRISASCGVAHWDPSDGEPLLTLNLGAEALKVAKTRGRASVVRYTSELAAQSLRNTTVKNRLRAALGSDAIHVHVQPIFALNGDVPIGMEALARWRDERLGNIPPDEFIAVAEESGLIHPLGLEIIRKSIPMYLASGLRNSGGRLWLNVSTIQLRVEGYTDQVRGLLNQAGLDLPNVVIEVTESVLVRRDDPALREVRKLAAGGAQIAVDDFGTGYASASYINRLPISILKFDSSLVAELDSHVGRAVVNALLNLASALDVSVVLEGIEDDILDGHVRELDGSESLMLQGWYYAKPTFLEAPEFDLIFGMAH